MLHLKMMRILFLGGGYEGKDENMNAFLDEYYTCILDYNEGGIHAGLYQKLN